MKKLLTVVLCIAVIFTFSFSGAFASSTETYTYDQWQEEVDAQIAVVKSTLDSAEKSLLADYKAKMNDEGFIQKTDKSDFTDCSGDTYDGEIKGYNYATIENVLNDIIKDVEDDMDNNFSNFTSYADYENIKPTPTLAQQIIKGTYFTNSGDAAYTAQKVVSILDTAALKAKLIASDTDLDKYQASDNDKGLTTPEIIDAKIAAIDLSNYDDEDKKWDYTPESKTVKTATLPADAANMIGSVASGATLTAADAADELITDIKEAVKAAKKLDNDTNKLAALEAAYAAFDTALNDGTNGIPDKNDQEYKDATTDTSLETAIDAYAQYGYQVASDLLLVANWGGSDKKDWSGKVGTGNDLEAFWEPTTGSTKEGELFGVKIADIKNVTRTEGLAVYNAMKAKITDSKTVLAGWADELNKDAYDVYALYCTGTNKKTPTKGTESQSELLKTLDAASAAIDKYADVKTKGEKMKKEAVAGVDQYDDAKVAAAVERAEKMVYADFEAADNNNKTYIDGSLYRDEYNLYADEYDYIVEAAEDLYDSVSDLKNDNAKQDINKFYKAIRDAVDKMWKTPTSVAAKKVSSGADKTPDEDLVYLASTYADYSDWEEIAEDAYNDLWDAQSYEEIDQIMAQVATDMGKLMKADDEVDVNKAVESYTDALKGYIKQCYGLLDSKSKYSDAYGDRDSKGGCALLAKGIDLLEDAATVDEVKAAYAEAQELVNNAKTNDELKDMKKAVESQISALPSTDKLTADDLTKVQEAYKAMADYYGYAGSKDVNNETVLYKAYEKVIAKVADQVKDDAEALWDKMDAVNTGSDEDVVAFAAYKAEANALVDKVDALNDDIDVVNDDDDYFASDLPKLTGLGSDYANIKYAVALNEGTIWQYEVENVKRLLNAADKTGATAEDVQKAIDAYNALTQRQQLDLDYNTYYNKIISRIINKDATSVKELKITAKSVAKKGSITVTWKVVGSADIDGYQVWKSTKHSKGYKKAFTTANKSYKNTKGLKKGVRYYYKVRAYKVVDGKNVYSDWSNKARRIAK